MFEILTLGGQKEHFFPWESQPLKQEQYIFPIFVVCFKESKIKL